MRLFLIRIIVNHLFPIYIVLYQTIITAANQHYPITQLQYAARTGKQTTVLSAINRKVFLKFLFIRQAHHSHTRIGSYNPQTIILITKHGVNGHFPRQLIIERIFLSTGIELIDRSLIRSAPKYIIFQQKPFYNILAVLQL